jgi:hypothetical protein
MVEKFVDRKAPGLHAPRRGVAGGVLISHSTFQRQEAVLGGQKFFGAFFQKRTASS